MLPMMKDRRMVSRRAALRASAKQEMHRPSPSRVDSPENQLG
jgi:hypothetical protein